MPLQSADSSDAPLVLRALVVEDERKVADAIVEGLHGEGFDVVQERSGEDAFFRLATESFDAVILDLGLPGRGGLEVLRAVRQRGVRTPVLVVTARDAVEDRVLGLDAGADDYLVKPFSFAELLARVRALVRRSATDAIRLHVGELTLDPVARTAERRGRPLDLTTREFELLQYFMRHHHEIVSRESLARDIWQEVSRGTPLDNVIDVHIARLRRKLDPDESGRLIQTIRGVGFLLSDTPDQAADWSGRG